MKILLLALGLLLPSPGWIDAAEPTCSEAGDSSFVDAVEKIWPMDDGRVGIAFRKHAAIYFVDKDDPCWKTWQPLLLDSLERSLELRISFRVKNQQITAVVPAESQPEP